MKKEEVIRVTACMNKCSRRVHNRALRMEKEGRGNEAKVLHAVNRAVAVHQSLLSS